MATRTSPSVRLSPWASSGRTVTSVTSPPPWASLRRTPMEAAGMICIIATRSSSAGRPSKGRTTNGILWGLGAETVALRA